ncbi:MAG: glycoside hydrolase family 92 protein, partial [Paramuribaculum sp.]|nr:glycoside hydrolase family 92 protein [Paramuribaculum sp.]
DIAYPYLFSQIKGEEWRTSATVDSLLHKFFTVNPDGIPGNDDTGTMSAWAVFSMMGFYPDIPGVPEYTLVTPTFDRVTIKLDPAVHGNDTLVIEKEKGGKASITLDGRKVPYRISHSDLVKGKKLKFTTTE